jgi:hypothetical protein
MIKLLETLLGIILAIGGWIIYSVVTVWNLIMAGLSAVVAAALLILPTMPTPAKIEPELLEEINWFFPFGTIATALIAGAIMYGLWLIVRYVFRLVRAA